jgi:hypothetical protein
LRNVVVGVFEKLLEILEGGLVCFRALESIWSGCDYFEGEADRETERRRTAADGEKKATHTQKEGSFTSRREAEGAAARMRATTGEIDSVVARAQFMRESLGKSQAITDSMIAILGSFDNRLSTLETAIRPTQVRCLHLPPSSSSAAA